MLLTTRRPSATIDGIFPKSESSKTTCAIFLVASFPDSIAILQSVYGNGNNKEDGCEGVHYKNVFGSYFHGPILSRNANLAYRLVTTALKKKYGQDIVLATYNDILSLEKAEEYTDVKSKAELEE